MKPVADCIAFDVLIGEVNWYPLLVTKKRRFDASLASLQVGSRSTEHLLSLLTVKKTLGILLKHFKSKTRMG